MSLQQEKALVLAHYAALDRASPDNVADILALCTSSDWLWQGFHPFADSTGAEQVAGTFWQPFLSSVTSLQRRPDIFFAGRNHLEDGGIWVVQMGHMMGLLDRPFLNMPATRKLVMLRYAEFNRVDDGRITRTAFYCDLPHMMRQAGVVLFPDQTAQHMIQPGPVTHDGLILDDRDPADGAKTLQLIERMAGNITDHRKFTGPEDELAECWTRDMTWFGPEGIGATYTIPRYIEQHQRPFRTEIADRTFNGHVARLAEGNYGGFFGRPNLTLTNTGRYLGFPGDGTTRADMHVIDIYRRDGDRLAENWIFIDILRFLKMQGYDLLANAG